MSATVSSCAEIGEFAADGLTLLRAQATLYARLESLAARQRSLISREDAGPLLALLADRQRLSTELIDVAARLEPVRRDWRAYRQRLDPVQQKEADQLVAEVEDRLRRVIDGDERDARLLAARKQSVAQSLRSTHATSEAIGAYRAPVDRAARLDHWDEDAL